MHEFMTLAMVNVFSEKKQKKKKKKKKLKLYNVSCNLVWSCLKQIINTDETCTFMTEITEIENILHNIILKKG